MYAIISDIHGNYPALKSVLNVIDSMDCSRIICLGDMVGYYCQPNECIDELRSRKVECLLGNHDYYLISNTCCSSKTVKMCIDYQRKILSKNNFNWLASLSPVLDTDIFSFRHAGWNNPIEERFTEFDFLSNLSPNIRYYASGHSHIPVIQKNGYVQYCNPGSVGQPRDGNPKASFALFSEKTGFKLCRVDYDINKVKNVMIKNNQGDWIWKCLFKGKKIGDD